jgi:peptidoglycan/xylan/chitin deacetylase (PgdA/CDA1 family)
VARAGGIDSGRWFAKKATRSAMMLGAWATGTVHRRSRAPDATVRVLTYHRFGCWPRDPFCVSEAEFEAQVCWIAEHCSPITLDELQAFLRRERGLPLDAVMLTADDGAHSVLTCAAPILRRHRVPMTAFITTGALDGDRVRLELPESFLTWEEAGRLREHGITVASHGRTHGSLGEMTAAQVRDEAERSRDAIHRELGFRPTAFAYPYGTPAHYNPMTRRVLADAGYETAFLSTHGPVRAGSDPLSLRRIKVEGGEPLWQFKLLARGGMDDWSVVDNALARLTQAKRRGAQAA